jgi:phosphonate transport system substrate-binding protein
VYRGIVFFLTVLFGNIAIAADRAPPEPDKHAPAAEDRALTSPASPSLDPASDQEEVRFGISPYLSKKVLNEAFEPIMVYLSQKTGRRFRLVIPESYSAMLSLVADGAVDFAYLPPASYVKARLRDRSLRLLLTDVLHGVDFYSGYIVVLETAGIDSLQDLRGKTMAFVDRESTSGYLMPMRHLVSRGIQPARFFGEIVFTGEHDESLRRLLAHEVDAIAISSGILSHFRRRGADLRNVRILSKTGVVPHDAVCATRGVPTLLAEEVQEILLGLNSRTAAGRAVLPEVPQLNGWRVGDPSEYDVVEDLIRRGEASDQ